MSESSLPIKNEQGYFEIRMESIGGMGANLAGKMLTEAAVLGQGLNGLVFAAYGSEKKGSPVKSYVRLADAASPIRINTPVTHPNLLVIFHPNLVGAEPVMNGVRPGSRVIFNGRMSPKEARDLLKFPGGLLGCVDAIQIAIDEKVKMNTVILGAICRISGFLKVEVLKGMIRETFEKKYPHLVEPNLKAFDRGYQEIAIEEFPADPRYPEIPFEREKRTLGWANTPIGGVIESFGNSVLKDMSAGREGFIPVYHSDKCIHCAECELICPDMCFIWQEGQDAKGNKQNFLRGINYQFCKGCQRCVAVCKHGALSSEVEAKVDKSTLNYLTGGKYE